MNPCTRLAKMSSFLVFYQGQRFRTRSLPHRNTTRTNRETCANNFLLVFQLDYYPPSERNPSLVSLVFTNYLILRSLFHNMQSFEDTPTEKLKRINSKHTPGKVSRERHTKLVRFIELTDIFN